MDFIYDGCHHPNDKLIEEKKAVMKINRPQR